MNIRFIRTPKGYVNLATVQRAKPNGDEKTSTIVVGDKVIDRRFENFKGTIVAILPTQGQWDCLYARPDRPEKDMVMPVLAWGLDVTGRLMPVTPVHVTGLRWDWGQGGVAVRKAGNPWVYGYDGYGLEVASRNEKAWRARVAKQHADHDRDIKAAQKKFGELKHQKIPTARARKATR